MNPIPVILETRRLLKDHQVLSHEALLKTRLDASGAEVQRLTNRGYSKTEIASITGLSRRTIQRALAK